MNNDLVSKLTIISNGWRCLFLMESTKPYVFLMKDDVCPASREISAFTYLEMFEEMFEGLALKTTWHQDLEAVC